MKLQDITAVDIQQHINRFALEHSPKTVCNVHGLLMAALKVDMPDFNAKVTLPPKQKKIKQYDCCWRKNIFLACYIIIYALTDCLFTNTSFMSVKLLQPCKKCT